MGNVAVVASVSGLYESEEGFLAAKTSLEMTAWGCFEM